MTPEHRLLQRCERFLNAVEALFELQPESKLAGHLAPKSREIRAEIRKLVQRAPAEIAASHRRGPRYEITEYTPNRGD